jgi:hypothetical protein
MTAHCDPLPVRYTSPSAFPPWVAYSAPIAMKQAVIARPPPTKGNLRPHLSTHNCANIVDIKMTIPETPDARKDALFDEKPAWVNKIGA